jgi:fructoselysine-6-P-deglycase FrlB-like protein
MKEEHPMLTNILSLAKPETWQSSIGLADYTASRWLDKIQSADIERVVLTGCGSSLDRKSVV